MSSVDLIEGLSESQAAAVSTTEGPLLILAGPGSGKTRVITHRIAYLISRGVSAEQILTLTFTNKAASEMQRRLDQLVQPSAVWMGTFHGFCVRILRRYARLVGLPENFTIYDVDDANQALKSAIRRADFSLTHTSIGALASRISYFKNRLVTPEILEREALSSDEHQVGQVYPYYQRELLANGAVDFDDLLMHTATLLRSSPELRAQLDEKFRYVMVDEYQDTNLAQYVIVRHLCIDHENLAVTGDPDQSIYSWRGANEKNVGYLERDYPKLQVIRLEDNYRSTPEILSVADCLIQNNAFRKSKRLIPSRNSGPAVKLAVYPTGRSEAESIAGEIASKIQAGENSPSDFAVFYRTNAQSRLIEQALVRQGILYQLIGGRRFYLRKEIKDLLAYLQLVYNPSDDVALRRAINVPPRGIGQKTLERVEQVASLRNGTMLEACQQVCDENLVGARPRNALSSFLKQYRSLCDLAHGPLHDLLLTAVELTKYKEYMEKQANGATDALDNLDELLVETKELDSDFERSSQVDDTTPLEKFLELAALQAEADRHDSLNERVTLMTLHAAKGLEFPWVYIIAVEENILPHQRSKDDPSQLEEERRLLFVGITRAQDRLQLSYAKKRGFGDQGSGIPSSFLMELPRGEMMWQDAASQPSSPYNPWPEAWDEACQIEPTSNDYADSQIDDSCQLDPSEIQQRLRQQASQSTTQASPFMLASEMLDQANKDAWAEYISGKLVEHEEFGMGTILSTSGFGPKRSVKILFEQDGSERTFRLSHSTLNLLD